ncbi:TetR/AcrR family transcriptional regulator [Xanthomonas massiliensis]|uniref:TetR/AcrR family transcriptional regulator n=1 Tax=Xanthomonas massiliensis TaxID=1720302 RepID=UPI000824AD74|nr:TetR/AcrR family transcriptional regulator [Xanthomonas massiliensis]
MSSHSPAPVHPPRSNGPGRPRDMGKRNAILEAARRLFFGQGFGGVSMDAIAAEAGVSKLTVYSHFGDKESLFSEAVRAQCSVMMPDTLFVQPPQGSLAEQLEIIGQAFLRMICSPAAVSTHRMMLIPGTGDEQVRRMFWQAGPARLQQVMAEFLQGYVDRGELVIDDVALAASQFFSLLKGELYSGLLCGLACDPDPSAVQAHVRASVRFFLRAYAPE